MTSAQPSARARAIAAKMPTPRIVPPTISGPLRVRVGIAVYNLPDDAQVVHAEHDPVAFVLRGDAVHIFGERGELIGYRAEVLDAIRRAHFT